MKDIFRFWKMSFFKEDNVIIKMNNHTCTHQELGLQEYIYGGKKYIDVTPFWIDSGETKRIKKYMESLGNNGRREDEL